MRFRLVSEGEGNSSCPDLDGPLPLYEKLREHSRLWPMGDQELAMWVNVAVRLMREAAVELEVRE